MTLETRYAEKSREENIFCGGVKERGRTDCGLLRLNLSFTYKPRLVPTSGQLHRLDDSRDSSSPSIYCSML